MERVRLTAQIGTSIEASAVRVAPNLQNGVAGVVKNGEARSDAGSQSADSGNYTPRNLTLIDQSPSASRFADATFPKIDGLSLSRSHSNYTSPHITPKLATQAMLLGGPALRPSEAREDLGPEKDLPTNNSQQLTNARGSGGDI